MRADLHRTSIEPTADPLPMTVIEAWYRVVPAVYMVAFAVTITLKSATPLWVLLPFVVGGAILRTHPLDVIYSQGLRPRIGGPALPPSPAPRRFGHALLSGWIMATLLLFDLGFPGWALVILVPALVLVALKVFGDICIACLLHQWLSALVAVLFRSLSAKRAIVAVDETSSQ